MKKLTPQLTLIGLFSLFLLIFLLPAFRIPLDYKAYSWELPHEESLEEAHLEEDVMEAEEGSEEHEQEEEEFHTLNLLTSQLSEVDPSDLHRHEETKSGFIEWAGLDISIFGLDSSLANFGRGAGIYPGYKYEYTAGTLARSLYHSDIRLIRNRLDASGFHDVRLEASQELEAWDISLFFPSYYGESQSRRISDLIMSPGEIAFFEQDLAGATTEQEPDQSFRGSIYAQLMPGFTPSSSLLNANDVASIQVITRTDYLVPVWEISFKEESRDKVSSILRRFGIDPDAQTNHTGGGNPNANRPVFSVEFDELPQIALIYQDGLTFTGAPLGLISTHNELKSTATYLLSRSVLSSNFSIQDTNNTFSSTYAPQGRVVLAWFIVVSVLFIVYVTYRKLGVNAVVAGGLAVAMPILLSISIVKLIATPISIGLILSIMTVIAITSAIVYLIFTGGESNINSGIRKLREFSAFMFAIGGVLFLSNLGFGVFQDVVGIVGIMGASIFMSTWIGFKQIFTWYFE